MIMSVLNSVVETDAVRWTLEILESLLGPTGLPGVSVRLWEGTVWPNNEPRLATLILNRPSALKEMLGGGSEVAVAEAYVHNAFDVEGDMIAACALSDHLAKQTLGWTKTLRIAAQLAKLPDFDNSPLSNGFRPARLAGRPHSQARDRRAIEFHYDLSNDFYALWLDPQMVMAGSAHGFLRGYLSVYQTLLAKLSGEGFAQVPLTRKSWYLPHEARHP